MINPFYDLSNSIYAYIRTLPYDEHYYSVIKGIIQCFPGYTHMKDASTFLYTATNSANLTLYGYSSSDEVLGKSIYDIAKKMGKRWPKDYDEMITEREKLVLTKNNAIIGFQEIPYVNIKGELIVNCLNKIPLLNDKKEPIALLTLAINVAPYKNRNTLRGLYQQVYKNKKQALEKFLVHIGLEKYVAQHNTLKISITNRELDCLILYSTGKSIKEIANQLFLSPRTIESYIYQVRDKFLYSSVTSMLEEFSHYYYEIH